MFFLLYQCWAERVCSNPVLQDGNSTIQDKIWEILNSHLIEIKSHTSSHSQLHRIMTYGWKKYIQNHTGNTQSHGQSHRLKNIDRKITYITFVRSRNSDIVLGLKGTFSWTTLEAFLFLDSFSLFFLSLGDATVATPAGGGMLSKCCLGEYILW